MAKVIAVGGSDLTEDTTATEMELRVDIALQPSDKAASTIEIQALLEKWRARSANNTCWAKRRSWPLMRDAGFNNFEVLAMLWMFARIIIL